MWDGPYGDWGSRKYLLASLDRSCSAWGWTMWIFSTTTAWTQHPAGGDDGRTGAGRA